jgi:riboflavin kinase / FMN adenylyltransferase
MTVIEWEDLLAGRTGLDGQACLTIGVFDGLHLGHRALIRAVIGDPCAIPVVVTFRQSPALLFGKTSYPGSILSLRQKLLRLEGLGVAATVVIDFSDELSKLSGQDFVGRLRDSLAVGKIAVGHDFRFGRDRETDAEVLREIVRGTDTRVEVIEPVLYGGTVVSSSRIRQSIRAAAFREVREMLAADYTLDLRGVPQARESTRIRRMRRNDIRHVLPKPGSYPVSCEAEAAARKGLLTVGEDEVMLELESAGEIAEATFIAD